MRTICSFWIHELDGATASEPTRTPTGRLEAHVELRGPVAENEPLWLTLSSAHAERFEDLAEAAIECARLLRAEEARRSDGGANG